MVREHKDTPNARKVSFDRHSKLFTQPRLEETNHPNVHKQEEIIDVPRVPEIPRATEIPRVPDGPKRPPMTDYERTVQALDLANRRLYQARADSTKNPGDKELRRQYGAALDRSLGLLSAELDKEGAKPLDATREVARSPETPVSILNFLTSSVIVVGAALLAATGGGILGAALVKEVVWKEAVKSAAAAFVTTTAAIVTDRTLQKHFPNDRR